MRKETQDGGWGGSADYIGVFQHGYSVTHIDALCHVWGEDGMWEGRDPDEEITFSGTRFGGVEQWSDGILTRGVLLDVPRHRGEPYVTVEKPVHGWELEAIAAEQGVSLEAGDALLVHCGREAYAAEGAGTFGDNGANAGLHASCLPFIRDHDFALLGWDMTDASPNEYGLPSTIHGIIYAYGVPILDNALLGPLAQVAAEEGRYEFMLTINPLVAVGATGSPVNPIAVF
jgi:kynurenine formamidase